MWYYNTREGETAPGQGRGENILKVTKELQKNSQTFPKKFQKKIFPKFKKVLDKP